MILVTGGTGLVGSHLLYHLLLENKVIKAIHQKNSNLLAVKSVFEFYTPQAEMLFKRIQWVEADLNDISDLTAVFRDVTHVYHCAALVSFEPGDYQKMRRINIDGTTVIVNHCIAHQVEKLCFVSSVAAIEKGLDGELMDESDKWNNTTDKSGYAITKYGAEMEVWRASQEGVPVVIINPGVILGSGFWHKGSGKLFSRVRKGLPFYTTGVTGFVGVQDVAKIMIKLMGSEIVNERYILVSENLSYKEVLFLIADALKKRRPHIRITKFMSACIWRFEFLKSKITLSSPLLTKRSAASSLSKHPYTSKKLIAALNYEFEPIAECIARISHNFRS